MIFLALLNIQCSPAAASILPPTLQPATPIPPTPADSETPLVAITLIRPTQTDTPTLTPPPTSTQTATSTPSPRPTETYTPNPTPVVVAAIAAGPRDARVPILMYHHIGDLPPDADTLRKSLTVSEENFDAQLKFISDQGFTAIHISDLLNYLNTGASLPPKPIVLTFDDGYDDNYLNAFPTLKDHKLGGTFFIITGRAEYNSPGYMTWEQIGELAQNGMEIGSHSLTHRYNLGNVAVSTQRTEIVQAHEELSKRFPEWLPIFSYPSGSYNLNTLDILHELNYQGAVTTRQGTLQSGDSPLELRRIRIRGEWDIKQFAYWFGYWTSRP